MTEPEGTVPEDLEQEASAGTDGDTPVEPAETPAPAEPAPPTVEQQLAERTLDLQRLQAEYVNYKRRVDRDRELVRAQGEAAVLQSLLTVLDDIARADEHGELSGGFKAVADSLQQAVTKHKLEAFGAKGDAFDPALHEAVFHAGESAEVEVTSTSDDSPAWNTASCSDGSNASPLAPNASSLCLVTACCSESATALKPPVSSPCSSARATSSSTVRSDCRTAVSPWARTSSRSRSTRRL